MLNPKHVLQSSKPFNKFGQYNIQTKSIYYGIVVDVNDSTDGGRIKVRIREFDMNVPDEKLPWAYPIRTKFFHSYPQKDEVVRVFLEDTKYPNIGRLWEGSIISQPHKFEFDEYVSALSTTDRERLSPDKSPSTYPDADGVYPDLHDIGIIGRLNTDIILKPNQILIRSGKHENDNPLKLNTKNPSQIMLSFDEDKKNGEYSSNSIVMGDKIALITHKGNPKFKSSKLTVEDREKIFENGHPIPRGDVLVEALNLIRKAILQHIHGYPTIPANKDILIMELEKIDFNQILQENIVIN